MLMKADDVSKGFLALTEKQALRAIRKRRKLTRTEEFLLYLFCIGWVLITIGLVLL